MSDKLQSRQQYFKNYFERAKKGEVPAPPPDYPVIYTCQCCGYPTMGVVDMVLMDRGHNPCFLCGWHNFESEKLASLNNGRDIQEARNNFEDHLDSRGHGQFPSSSSVIQTKKKPIEAFEALRFQNDHDAIVSAWKTVIADRKYFGNEFGKAYMQQNPSAIPREKPMSDELRSRRQYFDNYFISVKKGEVPAPPLEYPYNYTCQVCGYPTLIHDEKSTQEFCFLCGWCNDLCGENLSASLNNQSLADARQNFKDHLDTYDPPNPSWTPEIIFQAILQAILQAKKTMIEAFETLRRQNDTDQIASTWKIIVASKKTFDDEWKKFREPSEKERMKYIIRKRYPDLFGPDT